MGGIGVIAHTCIEATVRYAADAPIWISGDR
jgi:hypothetical protein